MNYKTYYMFVYQLIEKALRTIDMFYCLSFFFNLTILKFKNKVIETCLILD